jgi:hypothetical protein
MTTVGEGLFAANRADWLFRYSATVMQAVSLTTADGTPLVPAPFLYAVLAGFNNALTELPPPALEGEEPIGLKIRRAQFMRKLTDRQRWVGSDAQLRTVLDRFENAGLIAIQNGSVIETKPTLLQHLEVHARAVFKFMIEDAPTECNKASLRNWLELNSQIFSLFFFGNYGQAWREFRQRVNDKLNKPETLRKYTLDYVNDDPSFWVALNILAVTGPIDEWEINSFVKRMGLTSLRGNVLQLGKALEDLVAASIIVRVGGIYSISDEHAASAEGVKAAVGPGLQSVQSACEKWRQANC